MKWDVKLRWGLIVMLLSASSYGTFWWVKSKAGLSKSTNASLEQQGGGGVVKLKKKIKLTEGDRQGLMRAILKEAIYRNNSELESCYEAYLRREPAVSEGHLRLEWTVNEDGLADDFSSEGTQLQEVALEECIKETVRKISFKETNLPGVRMAHKFKFKQKTPSEIVFR